MRKAFMDMGLIIDATNIIGINLGYDFCSEHEWGVSGIKRVLGIGDAAKIGVDARKSTKCPAFIHLHEEKNASFIIMDEDRSWMDEARKKEQYMSTLKQLRSGFGRLNKEGHDISSMWSEGAFAFGIKGKDNEFAKVLYEAFKANNICMTLTPATFKGTGLTFIIRNLLDAETEAITLASDQKQQRLDAAVAKSGIIAKLKAANCGYFACSPKWRDDTETEVVFWLNPMEQDKHNFGWMTVQDLLDWTKGKGKIPMTPEQIKARNSR